MLKNPAFFYKKLIFWYLDNRRSMPWRETIDPYKIWLSEIILQQTRVAQGLPYYLKFTETYPSVTELADAPEADVLKLWQGLGYYSRARNLHATAKYVAYECQGVFPTTYKELLKLKGVGDYTASAIASICYNEAAAVVDGNVYRVLSRVFAINTPIDSSSGKKEFKAMAQQLIDAKQPGTFNQAIMEFGARHCVPQNPDCSSCIFNDRCLALKENKVAQLPVKSKALAVRKRYFNYMVVLSEDEKTILRQRTEKGIWQQLYEFPLVESTSEVSLKQLQQLASFQEISTMYQIESISLYNEASLVHKLSHQHLYTRFWILTLSEVIEKGIPFQEIESYAVPVLIGNFISGFSVFKA